MTARIRATEIGNAHGRIALYLDKQEALDLATLYGPSDRASDELREAVEKAYPAAVTDLRSHEPPRTERDEPPARPDDSSVR